MGGMDRLFDIALAVGIIFLPLTILVAIGWGTVVAGEAASRAASENKKEIAKKLIEHGRYTKGQGPVLLDGYLGHSFSCLTQHRFKQTLG
jgi:hypothetical protein